MSTKVRIEMNHDGWREILSSQSMADVCRQVGEGIAGAAGDGFEYQGAHLGYGGGRVGGFVSARTYEAMKSEATDKALTRAVHA